MKDNHKDEVLPYSDKSNIQIDNKSCKSFLLLSSNHNLIKNIIAYLKYNDIIKIYKTCKKMKEIVELEYYYLFDSPFPPKYTKLKEFKNLHLSKTVKGHLNNLISSFKKIIKESNFNQYKPDEISYLFMKILEKIKDEIYFNYSNKTTTKDYNAKLFLYFLYYVKYNKNIKKIKFSLYNLNSYLSSENMISLATNLFGNNYFNQLLKNINSIELCYCSLNSFNFINKILEKNSLCKIEELNLNNLNIEYDNNSLELQFKNLKIIKLNKVQINYELFKKLIQNNISSIEELYILNITFFTNILLKEIKQEVSKLIDSCIKIKDRKNINLNFKIKNLMPSNYFSFFDDFDNLFYIPHFLIYDSFISEQSDSSSNLELLE